MGDRKADGEVLRIADEIERYLSSHPNAADSLEGIAKWWLPRRRMEYSPLKVQQALDLLVESGVVRRATAPGVQEVYASNLKSGEPEEKRH